MELEYPYYVGVRFKSVGKIYFFATNIELNKLKLNKRDSKGTKVRV